MATIYNETWSFRFTFFVLLYSNSAFTNFNPLWFRLTDFRIQRSLQSCHEGIYSERGQFGSVDSTFQLSDQSEINDNRATFRKWNACNNSLKKNCDFVTKQKLFSLSNFLMTKTALRYMPVNCLLAIQVEFLVKTQLKILNTYRPWNLIHFIHERSFWWPCIVNCFKVRQNKALLRSNW